MLPYLIVGSALHILVIGIRALLSVPAVGTCPREPLAEPRPLTSSSLYLWGDPMLFDWHPHLTTSPFELFSILAELVFASGDQHECLRVIGLFPPFIVLPSS